MTDLLVLIQGIKSGQKITFFQGAGISTSAGIPDFRSAKTGLYANLEKFNLPYPEAVFDIDYFKKTPKPFYILAEELYPGKFDPTPFHFMLKVFQNHGLIKRVYTQNIDTLERIVGIDSELIVEAHGSFATNHCIKCGNEMSTLEIKKFMASNKIPQCKCKGLVKPDITFFGEGLPPRFFDKWEQDCHEVEIAIVAGTSLVVYPFASLPSEVEEGTLRVLINQEIVGDFNKQKDIVIIDDCDKTAEKIINLLGWKEELDAEKEKYVKEKHEKESYEKEKHEKEKHEKEKTSENKESVNVIDELTKGLEKIDIKKEDVDSKEKEITTESTEASLTEASSEKSPERSENDVDSPKSPLKDLKKGDKL